jgi:hypothetical protein
MVVEYAPLDEEEDTITPTPITPSTRASPPHRRSIKIENKVISFLKHDIPFGGFLSAIIYLKN